MKTSKVNWGSRLVAFLLAAVMCVPMCGLNAFAEEANDTGKTPAATEAPAAVEPVGEEAATEPAPATEEATEPEAEAEEPATEPAEEAPEQAAATVEDGKDAASEEEISAKATYYNVKFDVEGTIVKTLVIEEGDVATEPANPAIPAGFLSFAGWYLNDVAYDFSKAVTSNITLKAQFSDKYLVSFVDRAGKVIDSQQVAVGDSATATTRIVTPAPGKEFVGWTLDGTNVYNFATVITSNITLKPLFKDASNVTFTMYFISKGSAADPQYVIEGQTAQAPQDPTRKGYEFLYWSTTENGAAFDFNTPITADTVLYGVWKPLTVDYTIVYWEEKANISGSVSTADASQWEYYGKDVKAGVSGTQVSAAIGDCPTIKYFQFLSADTKTVSGTGSTIVNVYYSRIEYTVQFNLGTGTMNFGGNTYTASQYSFKAKYQQDIGNLWPSQKNATFDNGALGFRGWSIPNAAANYATQRLQLSAQIIDDGALTAPVDRIDATANWNSTRDVQINYWMQQVPGQPTGEEAKVFNGVTYEKSSAYSQALAMALSSNLQAKFIEGYVNTSSVYDDNGSGVSTATASNAAVYDFYYNRSLFTLSFDTQGGSSIADVPNVLFQKKLKALKPADPTRANYVFAGWYYDANYNLPFDFETGVMPQNNLRLFAKWEPAQHKANFFNHVGDTTPVEVQGIAQDSFVTAPARYTVGQAYEGLGEFEGWYWYLPKTTKFISYYWETPVAGDVNLYAQWKTDGFTVTYEPGAGTGTVSVDTNTYSVGTLAPVKDGAGLIPPAGEVFVGWTTASSTATYYPGNTIKMNGSVVLVARYVNTDNVVNLNYNANFGDTPEATTPFPVVKNEAVTTDPYMFTTVKPDGVNAEGETTHYSFAGWSTDPNAKPNDAGVIAVGDAFRTASDATLYAVWRETIDTIITPNAVYNASYTVTGDVPSGYTAPKDTKDYATGDTIKVAAVPSVEGYVFDGWYYNGKKVTTVKVAAENVELTGSWKKVTDTKIKANALTGNDGNGTDADGSSSKLVSTGDVDIMGLLILLGMGAFGAGAAVLAMRRRRDM